jgi:hypothetical protein
MGLMFFLRKEDRLADFRIFFGDGAPKHFRQIGHKFLRR